MCKRVKKSPAIPGFLDVGAASRLVGLSNYCVWFGFIKSSVVYAASLCRFVRFETIIWPSIKFGISISLGF